MSEQVSPTNSEELLENWPIGWLVEEETGTDPVLTHKLVLAFYGHSEDELLFQHCVWSSTRSDARSMGEKSRALQLWSAVARYLNAGGELWTISNTLGEIPTTTPKIDLPSFYLLNTFQEPDLVSHAFIDYDSTQVLVWEEGQSVTLLDASDYYNDLATEEQALDAEDEFGDPWQS